MLTGLYENWRGELQVWPEIKTLGGICHNVYPRYLPCYTHTVAHVKEGLNEYNVLPNDQFRNVWPANVFQWSDNKLRCCPPPFSGEEAGEQVLRRQVPFHSFLLFFEIRGCYRDLDHILMILGKRLKMMDSWPESFVSEQNMDVSFKILLIV